LRPAPPPRYTIAMLTEIRRQLSVAIENEPGRLGQVGRLLASLGIHIDAICVIDNIEQGMVRLMTSDPAAAREALKAEGLPVVEAEVLAVQVTDQVGNLAAVGEALAAAGINIEYAYASTAEVGQPALLILRTPGIQRARDVLLAALGEGK
jgi:hypothetical protein